MIHPNKSQFSDINDVFDAFFGASEPVSVPSVSTAGRRELDNRGATFPDDTRTQNNDLRKHISERWKLKHEVVGILRKPENKKEDGSSYAVCGCGYGAVFKNDDGDLKGVEQIDVYRRYSCDDASKYKVGVSGALRCNSPWLCPSCAPKKAEERRQNIENVVDTTNAMGGVTGFVTFTIRHNKNQSLSSLKSILSTASRKARQGRAWQEIKEEADILGVVQGIEVLHNVDTGWHYHAHLAVPCLTSKNVAFNAMKKFVNRYISEVHKAGGEALLNGQDIQIIEDSEDEKASQYISKGSAAWEIAGSLKDARSKLSRTPWDLVKLASAGDESAEKLFVEYAQNIVGTRSCVISPSLAEALGLDIEPENDEVFDVDYTAGETNERDEIVVSVLTDSWRKLMSYGVAWQVVQAVERGKNSIECDDVVQKLLGDIKQKEWQRERELKQSDADSKLYEITSFEILYEVIENSKLGMSVSDAKEKALKYFADRYRKIGKVAVFPSDDETDSLILSANF